MRQRVLGSAAALAVLLASSRLGAATIVPPRDLGELGRGSDAVVLARALGSVTAPRGGLLFTESDFEVLVTVAGGLDPGARVQVVTPGGELERVGLLVPGSPRFAAGTLYLLFLAAAPAGRWQPRMLSYGLLRRVEAAEGRYLLVPLDEAAQIRAVPRPDGEAAEAPDTYDEAALLAHLTEVVGGTAGWDASRALAPTGGIPPVPATDAVPPGCAFMRDMQNRPLRWSVFDAGGSVGIRAVQTGDDLLPGRGFDQVAGALSDWMGITATTLDLDYAGMMSYSMACTAEFDTPDWNTRIVVFNDPCEDIPDLAGCSGILGIGGVWFDTTHTFDGQTWRTITSWYLIVNDGAGGCLSAADYRLTVAHELGHGLGFDHVSDPGALMYELCCNDIDDTDRRCARYAYPSSSPQPPLPPTNVQASDGAFTDRVRRRSALATAPPRAPAGRTPARS